MKTHFRATKRFVRSRSNCFYRNIIKQGTGAHVTSLDPCTSLRGPSPPNILVLRAALPPRLFAKLLGYHSIYLILPACADCIAFGFLIIANSCMLVALLYRLVFPGETPDIDCPSLRGVVCLSIYQQILLSSRHRWTLDRGLGHSR